MLLPTHPWAACKHAIPCGSPATEDCVPSAAVSAASMICYYPSQRAGLGAFLGDESSLLTGSNQSPIGLALICCALLDTWSVAIPPKPKLPLERAHRAPVFPALPASPFSEGCGLLPDKPANLHFYLHECPIHHVQAPAGPSHALSISCHRWEPCLAPIHLPLAASCHQGYCWPESCCFLLSPAMTLSSTTSTDTPGLKWPLPLLYSHIPSLSHPADPAELLPGPFRWGPTGPAYMGKDTSVVPCKPALPGQILPLLLSQFISPPTCSNPHASSPGAGVVALF